MTDQHKLIESQHQQSHFGVTLPIEGQKTSVQHHREYPCDGTGISKLSRRGNNVNPTFIPIREEEGSLSILQIVQTMDKRSWVYGVYYWWSCSETVYLGESNRFHVIIWCFKAELSWKCPGNEGVHLEQAIKRPKILFSDWPSLESTKLWREHGRVYPYVKIYPSFSPPSLFNIWIISGRITNSLIDIFRNRSISPTALLYARCRFPTR